MSWTKPKCSWPISDIILLWGLFIKILIILISWLSDGVCIYLHLISLSLLWRQIYWSLSVFCHYHISFAKNQLTTSVLQSPFSSTVLFPFILANAVHTEVLSMFYKFYSNVAMEQRSQMYCFYLCTIILCILLKSTFPVLFLLSFHACLLSRCSVGFLSLNTSC